MTVLSASSSSALFELTVPPRGSLQSSQAAALRSPTYMAPGPVGGISDNFMPPEVRSPTPVGARRAQHRTCRRLIEDSLPETPSTPALHDSIDSASAPLANHLSFFFIIPSSGTPSASDRPWLGHISRGHQQAGLGSKSKSARQTNESPRSSSSRTAERPASTAALLPPAAAERGGAPPDLVVEDNNPPPAGQRMSLKEELPFLLRRKPASSRRVVG